MQAGEGMQGPAGVRRGLAPVEAENTTDLGDLEPGAMERPEGIVNPSGHLIHSQHAGLDCAIKHAVSSYGCSSNVCIHQYNILGT